MDIKELTAILDIVNREITEQAGEERFGGLVPIKDPYTGETKTRKEYFSMDNPEKQEWVRRLKEKGVIVI